MGFPPVWGGTILRSGPSPERLPPEVNPFDPRPLGEQCVAIADASEAHVDERTGSPEAVLNTFSQVKALFQKLEVDAKVIELDEVVEGDDVQVALC